MILKPGETAVLIVRRSGEEPEKYFVAVRTSMSSSFDKGHDFEIGSPQIAITELGERSDVDAALNEAITVLSALER